MTVRYNNMILCQEKSKKLKFWKMKSKVRFEYSDKPQYLRWNFFSKVSIKFSVGFVNIYQESGRSNQPRSFVNKKIVTVRHTFPKIFPKAWKKLFFSLPFLTKCYTFCNFFKNRWLKVPDDLRYPFRLFFFCLVNQCDIISPLNGFSIVKEFFKDLKN